MQIKHQTARWQTLPELIEDKARTNGDAPFIEVDGSKLTYRELERESARLAAGLARAGVQQGEKVASQLYNCIEQLLLWFAVNRLGAIWTPLNASLRGKDLSYTLGDCRARLFFVDEETAENLATLDAAQRADLSVYGVAGALPPGARPFEELMQAEGPAPAVEVSPHDVAMIIYTGGTTGLPKGVMLPQFSFICAGYRYAEAFDVTAADRHYTTLPLFHAAAIQFAVMGPLVNDMTSVIDRRFSVSAYWPRVREVGATMIDPIGTIVSLLCQQPETKEDRAHGVRLALGITGQIPEAIPRTFKRRFGIPMVDMYGLTEAGGAMITTNRLHDYVEGSNGKTYGWVELAIFDENDEPVPPGTIGEIVLRPTVASMFMTGYCNNPKRTLECYRNLWFHTDDLGYLDEGGSLFFVGRHVHWLRRRGENVSAYEIESILSEHPGIQEVVVVGVPAELGEEEIKACIIPDPDSTPDPVGLITWAKDRMAAFKLPRFICYVEDFPRSATKREVERAKIKAWPNEGVWDREAVMGRFSAQSKR
ncbi:MAG: AMP-binding protein [Kiloniellales bacterium]